MSYNATVFRVMIASPSDVVEERDIIREVINRWNAINSYKTKIVLLPVGWETHLSPETGDKPQAIISKRILKDCDLLVGVFFMKVGTPTDKYESGTIEEIEEHIKANKPAMLYFSKSLGDKDKFDDKQYKKSCVSRSIYNEYKNTNDFKDRFYEHLQIKINEHDYFVEKALIENIILPEEEQSAVPDLTEEAKTLLKEATLDNLGLILTLKFMNGISIQTNGRQFIEGNNPREIAIWEDALEELESKGLVKAQGYKRESFKVTKSGYEIADLLNIKEN